MKILLLASAVILAAATLCPANEPCRATVNPLEHNYNSDANQFTLDFSVDLDHPPGYQVNVTWIADVVFDCAGKQQTVSGPASQHFDKEGAQLKKENNARAFIPTGCLASSVGHAVEVRVRNIQCVVLN